MYPAQILGDSDADDAKSDALEIDSLKWFEGLEKVTYEQIGNLGKWVG